MSYSQACGYTVPRSKTLATFQTRNILVLALGICNVDVRRRGLQTGMVVRS
jgi:hypothetical protein